MKLKRKKIVKQKDKAYRSKQSRRVDRQAGGQTGRQAGRRRRQSAMTPSKKTSSHLIPVQAPFPARAADQPTHLTAFELCADHDVEQYQGRQLKEGLPGCHKDSVDNLPGLESCARGLDVENPAIGIQMNPDSVAV